MGKLVSRYGLSPAKAVGRTRRLVRLLADNGCSPTLAAPGLVVETYSTFMRELTEAGVELAVHSFDHVDFRGLTAEKSQYQLKRAAQAFGKAGVEFKGFRCPYLSFSHEMVGYVPAGLFSYSSNDAIWWDIGLDETVEDRHATVFTHLSHFYEGERAEDGLVLPRFVGDLVEIPVSLPDDLQLLDGLEQGAEGVAAAWLALLRQSHERGAVFTVLMHPESFDACADAYAQLLAEAHSYRPPVWITRLSDIADWWHERRAFAARIDGGSIVLDCSARATVLQRQGSDGGYVAVQERALPVTDVLPFVGVAADVPEAWMETLRQRGYGFLRGDGAERCAVQLRAVDLHALRTDRQLVSHIESQPGPLLRFAEWPDGAQSALCITGDLDALSLRDYARRASAFR